MPGRSPFSDDPKESIQSTVIACPVCGSKEFDGRANEFEIYRICRKCGNRWSGGSMAAARPDFAGEPAPPPGIPEPYDEDEGPRYTGAGFRDPNRNYDGE